MSLIIVSSISTKTISGLTLTGNGKAYKVLGCEVVRSLNTFPAASVTVALGYDITAKEMLVLESLKDDLDYEWSLGLAGSTNVELFRGYLIAVAKTTALSVVGSHSLVRFKLISKAARMQYMAVAGYHYWDEQDNGLNKKKSEALKRIRKYMTPGNIDALLGKQLPYLPTKDVGQFIIDGVATMQYYFTDLEETMEEIKGYFDLQKTIQIISSLEGTTVQQSMRKKLTSSMYRKWMASNVWATILFMCNANMFCNIVPYNHSLDIIPAFPWKRDPEATLNGDQIMVINDQTNTGSLQDDFEAVFVEIGDLSTELVNKPKKTKAQEFLEFKQYISYPENLSKIPVGMAKIVSVPAWLKSTLAYTMYNTKDIDKGKRVDLEKEKIAEAGDERRALMPTIGEAIAKAYFSEAKNQQISLSVRIPWDQFEFMNLLGYVIKIDNVSIAAQDEKGPVYGMLNSFVFEAKSSPGGSSASIMLTLTHLRDEALNEQYGLDEHPIYRLEGKKAEAPASTDVTQPITDNDTSAVAVGAAYAANVVLGAAAGASTPSIAMPIVQQE